MFVIDDDDAMHAVHSGLPNRLAMVDRIALLESASGQKTEVSPLARLVRSTLKSRHH
jgi:hypothetical protein